MYTNNLEIIVNAPIKKVWNALTDKSKIREWMKGVEVDTDWKEGSAITYKCFDRLGNIVTWNGKQMIWDGIVESVHPHKELSCVYPSKATGLEKESYHLTEVFPEITKIILRQECLSPEAANGYVDSTRNTLQKLKEFLETRY
jgi:uncharacterized protein YndB with AHSA1/START domain